MTYSYLAGHLDFPVIGDPNRHIFDYEWFYDSNFHMNSAGMFLYTRQLTEDLKSALGLTIATYITVPEKPAPLPPVPEGGLEAPSPLCGDADLPLEGTD